MIMLASVQVPSLVLQAQALSEVLQLFFKHLQILFKHKVKHFKNAPSTKTFIVFRKQSCNRVILWTVRPLKAGFFFSISMNE